MAEDPLLSPKLKIERAKSLVQEAEARITNYTSTTPCNIEIGPHPNDKRQKVAIIKVAEPVPVDISLIVGDAIHNIRTALDHLAGCLAVANGKTLNGVYFPFAEDRAGYEAYAPEKIKKLPPRARELINGLKPYGGGNDILHLIHKLDVRDKHRTLFFHATYLGQIGGTFSCDHPVQISREPFGTLDKGVHFATFPAKAKFEQQLQISIGVTFADVAGIEGEPVLTILHQFIDLTEQIITIFEREFFT